MSVRMLPVLTGLCGVFLAGGSPLEGQIRASERGQVSQTVDGTTITIDYARPRARGRESVFGGEVHWGEVWTPGANLATTLDVDRNVRINGHAVPKGKYSVWMTVRKDGAWTVIFDTTTKLFHTERPGEESWQIRFDLRPEPRPSLEVLTWWFPEVRSDGVTLAMQWSSSYVPLNVTVEPSRPLTIAADLARPYLGEYDFKWAEQAPDSSEAGAGSEDGQHHRDSSGTHEPPPGTTFEVFYDKGSLWARVDPAPFPGMETVLLIRKAGHWFFPAMMKDGQVYDTMDDMVMEFKVENGTASGFEVRVEDDELIASATRKP